MRDALANPSFLLLQASLDTGLGSYGPLVAVGLADIFVIKVSSSGSVTGAVGFGGSGIDMGLAIRAGPDNTIYVAGTSTDAMVRGALDAWRTGGHNYMGGGGDIQQEAPHEGSQRSYCQY